MKHINAALERLHSGGPIQVDNDSSLLQRILALDPDPRTACILAIDMFLVGIDTVRYRTHIATNRLTNSKERVPLQKSTAAQLLKKFSTFYGT
jgi:hypothetical protein